MQQKKTDPTFRLGNNPGIKTLVLLSAPGGAEKKANRPAAGATGKTLEIALKSLHELHPLTFPSHILDDYTIANSVESIHYKASTGRTEATNQEVLEENNLARLRMVLEDCNSVLALGKKAELAIDNLGFHGLVIKGFHPSMQALNRKFFSDKRTSYERRVHRISQWVNSMYFEISK